MARPKVLKKPSKKRLERERRRETRRLRRRNNGVVFLQAGGISDYQSWVSSATSASVGGITTITHTENTNAAITFRPSRPMAQRYQIRESQVVIESLDEGRTWHTRDTHEPAFNVDGQLILASNQSGPAPECMRQGSGTYEFTITIRGATDQEAREWYLRRAAEERRGREEAREREREQQRLWELTAEARSRHAVEEAEKRKRAQERARTLLLSHLTRSQRRDYEERGGFWVWSQFGNLYWVTRYTAVRFDERGVALQRYCIHAIADVPAEDNALLRKLVLECDEERFLKTANGGIPAGLDFMRQRPEVVTVPNVLNPMPTGGDFQIVGGATGNGGTISLTNGSGVTTLTGGSAVGSAGGEVVIGSGVGTVYGDYFRPVWTTMPRELRTDVVLVREEPTAVVLHEDQTPGPDEIPDCDLTLFSHPPLEVLEVGPLILLNVNGYVRPLCG